MFFRVIKFFARLQSNFESVPTLVRFVGGDPVDRIADGFVPSEDLLAFVEGVSVDAGV